MGVIEPPVRIDKLRLGGVRYATTSCDSRRFGSNGSTRDQLFLRELSREMKAQITNARRRNKA